MQRPDAQKRKDILRAAEKLFAAKPFHEVKLDEVAARAKIGKGTIYIYFKSKEDLYGTLVREGLTELAARLQEQLASGQRSSLEDLRLIVAELVGFAAARPGMYQLLRQILPKVCSNGMHLPRQDLVRIIHHVIQRGIERGEMCDPYPELTAQLILSSVRGAMLFGPAKMTPAQLSEQILYVVGTGISCRAKEM